MAFFLAPMADRMLFYQTELPPHVRDLYAFLINYLAVTKQPTYSTLRTAFLHAEISRLPVSLPRLYPAEQWIQALYQPVLLLLRTPCLLNRFTQITVPETYVRQAALALLVLLEGSTQNVAVLVDEKSALAIAHVGKEGGEAGVLVEYLKRGRIKRGEAGMRGGVVVPEVLGGRRKRWGSYGYEVDESVVERIVGEVRGEVESMWEGVVKEGKDESGNR